MYEVMQSHLKFKVGGHCPHVDVNIDQKYNRLGNNEHK